MLKKIILILLLLIIIPSVKAVTEGAEFKTTVISDSPTISIITPGENDQIFGETVVINFIVNDFEIINYKGTSKNEFGQGHLHLWFDQTQLTASNSQEIVKPTSIKLDKVSAGQHKITLELVNNNHSHLDSPVINSVNFTTKAEPKVENTIVAPTITKNLEKIKKVQGLASMTSFISYTLIIVFVVLTGTYIIFKQRNS